MGSCLPLSIDVPLLPIVDLLGRPTTGPDVGRPRRSLTARRMLRPMLDPAPSRGSAEPSLEVRHERAACRVRPMLHRSTRPDRPTRRPAGLGVEADRIYVDHGLTGTNREHPGLREALAACRAGDTLG